MSNKRWKLTIEYDGRPFSGWQLQDSQPSVQGEIERALHSFCQKDIRIHAAGRTDTGVHAKGQVAHFDLNYGARPLTGYDLAKAINAHLRDVPVAILHAEEVGADFHARFSATDKLYRYRIVNRPAPLAMDAGFAWHVWRPLDVDAMQDAAQVLVGRHDFTTFRATECQAKNPVRTITRLDLRREGENIFMEAQGRSFLHHQMRNMIGTLRLVGEGKWGREDVAAALAACDRTKGGMTAPPDGLTLMRVDYA